MNSVKHFLPSAPDEEESSWSAKMRGLEDELYTTEASQSARTPSLPVVGTVGTQRAEIDQEHHFSTKKPKLSQEIKRNSFSLFGFSFSTSYPTIELDGDDGIDQDDLPFHMSLERLMQSEEETRHVVITASSANESTGSLQKELRKDKLDVHRNMAHVVLNDEDQWQKLRIAMTKDQGVTHMGLNHKMTGLLRDRIQDQEKNDCRLFVSKTENLNDE
jgi:hypothetical protein